jgi:Asp-tRNA(Asn)/Glu-tRNA(Gln) amidotransferase A subunit family amidase
MNMALEDFDVLIHPATAPAGIAGPLTTDPVSMTQESLAYFHNTCATNITGHPSVSVPAGTVDGAPVGVHITGRHGEDGLVLLVASLFEEILSR